MAAKRTVWGKLLNSGQTCVAPDYVYVHKSVKERFIEAASKYIVKFYGENPQNNPQYPKIINEKHFLRLSAFLDDAKIAFGGKVSAKDNKIAPTLLTGVDWESPVMKEEIFGPILPIMDFYRLDEVITAVKSKPKPLALYLFTNDKKAEQNVLQSLSFGGGCINDTIVHLATSYMPFGGAGDSGMGGYHGKFGFDTFSRKKSVLKKSNIIDVPLRYWRHHLLYWLFALAVFLRRGAHKFLKRRPEMALRLEAQVACNGADALA